MAINAPLQTFIGSIQGKVAFCHHATLAILRCGKLGESSIPSGDKAAEFGASLAFNRSTFSQFDARASIPPHLYDVFGFFAPGPKGQIIHSAIVVDATPPVTLAECENLQGRVILTPLPEILSGHERCETQHFPVEAVEAQIQILDLYAQLGRTPPIY